MKLIYTLLFFAFAPLFSFGQCNVTISHTDAGCYGASNGTALASATGTSPFGYVWSPGNQTTASVNGLTAGTYTVTMTDALACVATATVTITSLPPVTATITSTPPSCGNCCDGSASIIFSGGPGPYTYQWIPSGGQVQTATGLCAGTYTCCATDGNGCGTCTNGCPVCQNSVTLSPATGIDEPVSTGNLTVFPTPASQTVSIQQTFAKPVSVEITLTNLLGEAIYTQSAGTAIKLDTKLDISSLPDGTYFITVKTMMGSSTKRIIKQ